MITANNKVDIFITKIDNQVIFDKIKRYLRTITHDSIKSFEKVIEKTFGN